MVAFTGLLLGLVTLTTTSFVVPGTWANVASAASEPTLTERAMATTAPPPTATVTTSAATPPTTAVTAPPTAAPPTTAPPTAAPASPSAEPTPTAIAPAAIVPAAASPANVSGPPPRRTGLGVIHAPGDGITLADLKTIFGSKVSTSPRVAEGLPSLNQAMRAGNITTPERRAAFLATLAYESTFDYALNEAGVGAAYRGRGYMQLTGDFNYRAAGNHLGVNLLGNPSLAASLEYSAPIAIWYWTIQRPHTNTAADNFDMGLVSRYIGYGASSYQDELRCAAFKKAYQHFSGQPAPSSTVCYRH